MKKGLLGLLLVGVVFGSVLEIHPKMLSQSESLLKDVVGELKEAESFDSCARNLQAAWALRYFVLVYKGIDNPLKAACYGKDTIEGVLKSEMANLKMYAVGYEKRHKLFLSELHKDLKAFVQRTIEFLVQTNQLEVAQVLARGFTEGSGFHFV